MTVHGCASSTTRWKARRYTSRSGRSSTSELARMRSCSASLPAKCFSDVPTPSPCTPRTQAVARAALSTGSSEKYSKFRPPRGSRLMFTPRPEQHPDPLRPRLPAESGTDLTGQVRVPRLRQSHRRREAGRRLAAGQAEVVRRFPPASGSRAGRRSTRTSRRRRPPSSSRTTRRWSARRRPAGGIGSGSGALDGSGIGGVIGGLSGLGGAAAARRDPGPGPAPA